MFFLKSDVMLLNFIVLQNRFLVVLDGFQNADVKGFNRRGCGFIVVLKRSRSDFVQRFLFDLRLLV